MNRNAAAIAGFLLLGLSPSFVDWQQSPDRRGEIVLYYAATIALLYVGLLRE